MTDLRFLAVNQLSPTNQTFPLFSAPLGIQNLLLLRCMNILHQKQFWSKLKIWGIQFIVFTLCTFCFWFWGLQAYLLSVFNKMDSMSPTQVFTGHSHLQAQNYPQLVDLFTDSVTVSPEEYERNHGLSDMNLQKCGASAGIKKYHCLYLQGGF